MVTRDEWRSVFGILLPGRKLRLTFCRDAVQDVVYLVGMLNRTVRVDQVTGTTLSAIVQSESWGHDSNRTVIVEPLPTFWDQIRWFEGRLLPALEKIEVLPPL